MHDLVYILPIQILGGAVFALSSFVVYRWWRAWKRTDGHPLPAHVWTIATSYNFLVLSMMFRVPKEGIAFFGCTGLAMGVWSLWILARYQNRPRIPRSQTNQ